MKRVVIRSFALFLSVIVSAAAFSGCDGRPSRVPVTGNVTYEGQPLKEGKIIFEVAGARSAEGKIVDGRIVDVFTFEPGDGGAIPGRAKAAVFATGSAPAASPAATPADPGAAGPVSMDYMSGGASLIPARYNNPATSGLEYEISPDGPNDFEVKLTK
jgi:hypothetical protein